MFQIAFKILLSLIVLGINNEVRGELNLAVLNLNVDSPSPDSGDTSFISGRETPTTFTIDVYNLGNEDLAASSSGDNYRLNLSLSTSTNNDDPYYISLEFSDSDEEVFSDSLSVSDARARYQPTATIRVPTSTCNQYTHLCAFFVDIEFADEDSSDDFVCIEFGNGLAFAGIKECTADLVTSDLKITDRSTLFLFGDDEDVTLSIILTNDGESSIPSMSDGSSNYEISCLASNGTDLDSASTLEFDLDDSSPANLDVSITSGSSITIENLICEVDYPGNSCEGYEYLCLRFSPSSEADFTDGDLDNSYSCIAYCAGYTINSNSILLALTVLLSGLYVKL